MNMSSLGGDPSGVIRLVLTKFLQETDDMLPARVISYNRKTNQAKVQPLIVVTTQDKKRVPRAEVASIPVLQLGGGGWVISFPIAKGDLGWIKSNDRDISLFKQFLNESAPNTLRLHDFADAMFIPDVMGKLNLADEDLNNLVIQNLAGTQKLAFWPTFIKLVGRLGIGGTPRANAILDVASTTQASNPYPPMTVAQRDAIAGPTEPMFVWLSDLHRLSVYTTAGGWS